MKKITIKDIEKVVKELDKEFGKDYTITFKAELKPEAIDLRIKALKYSRSIPLPKIKLVWEIRRTH